MNPRRVILIVAAIGLASEDVHDPLCRSRITNELEIRDHTRVQQIVIVAGERACPRWINNVRPNQQRIASRDAVLIDAILRDQLDARVRDVDPVSAEAGLGCGIRHDVDAERIADGSDTFACTGSAAGLRVGVELERHTRPRTFRVHCSRFAAVVDKDDQGGREHGDEQCNKQRRTTAS